jgi:hypothetical protein
MCGLFWPLSRRYGREYDIHENQESIGGGGWQCIDYRRDDGRFWLSAHDCQVSNPNFAKLRSTTANLDFCNYEVKNHQCLLA